MKDNNKNKTNVPNLRFPGFEGEWEEKKLGDLGDVKMCKRIFNEETSPEGEIPFYKIGSFGKDADAYISKELYLDYKKRFSFPKKGDILISAAGTIGRTVVYNGEDSYYQDSNIIWIENDKLIISNEFLFYILQIVKFNTEGGTIQRLYNNILKSTKFWNPSLPEQTQIASFLSLIDERIQFQSKIIEGLMSFKSAVSRKIFSQELRFQDENGEDFSNWEMRKLGEVSDVRDGTHDSPKYHETGYPFITSKNLLKNGSIDFENVTFINKMDYDKFNGRSKVEINDILFGMIGTIGNPVLVKSNGFAIKNVALIKQKDELLNVFLIHFLKGDSINQQFFEQNTGGTQKFLSLSIIRNLSVMVPSLPEQTQIANFLFGIDKKINLETSLLQQLKLQKQYFLQQMFI